MLKQARIGQDQILFNILLHIANTCTHGKIKQLIVQSGSPNHAKYVLIFHIAQRQSQASCVPPSALLSGLLSFESGKFFLLTFFFSFPLLQRLGFSLFPCFSSYAAHRIAYLHLKTNWLISFSKSVSQQVSTFLF